MSFLWRRSRNIGWPENWHPTFNDPDSGGEPITFQCKYCNASTGYYDDYGDARKAWNNRIYEKSDYMDKATEKQIKLVSHIIDTLGVEEVKNYLNKFFPGASLLNLSKKQAQKLITGLDSRMPRKIIYGVYGRDVF